LALARAEHLQLRSCVRFSSFPLALGTSPEHLARRGDADTKGLPHRLVVFDQAGHRRESRRIRCLCCVWRRVAAAAKHRRVRPMCRGRCGPEIGRLALCMSISRSVERLTLVSTPSRGLMDRETELEDRVRDIFVHQLRIEVPSVDTDLLSGILDSLKIVELLLEVEKQLSTRLPIQELEVETFRSIRHIAHFLAQRLDLQDKVIVQT